MKTGTNIVVTCLHDNFAGHVEIMQREWPKKEKRGRRQSDGEANESAAVRFSQSSVRWKHEPGMFGPLPDDVYCIFCIREPLSWLGSLRRTRGQYREYLFADRGQQPLSPGAEALRAKHQWILLPMKVVDPYAQMTASYDNVMAFFLSELMLIMSGKKFKCSLCRTVDCQKFSYEQADCIFQIANDLGVEKAKDEVVVSKIHAKTKTIMASSQDYMREEIQGLDLYESERQAVLADERWPQVYTYFQWPWPCSIPRRAAMS